VISLRDARPEDAQRVYAWNCAPEVRALSGDARPVAFTDHVRWFRKRLREPRMWIVEDLGVAVGIVRIDGDDAISIALDPAARGRGIGRRAIAAACALRDGAVVASIHQDNHASRACFEACGFAAFAQRDAFVTYRWSPS
jgi:spore coat polysaccharide biosynthesis protein SpsF